MRCIPASIRRFERRASRQMRALEYVYFCQIKLLLDNNNNRSMRRLKMWASEEEQLLVRVSCAAKGKKWKQASRELREHGFDRSDAECRERFVNHLDPSVNKQLWSEEELATLYRRYGEYGNKWFLIQKHLPGRTQTKIKNYFYGNIRLLLKIALRAFVACSTGFINDLRTEALVNIYESQEEYEGMPIVRRAIKLLGYRVQQQSCERLIRQHRGQFYQFIRCFLQNSKLKATICLPDQPTTEETPSPTLIPCGPAESGWEDGAEGLRLLAEYHLSCFRRYQAAYAELAAKWPDAEPTPKCTLADCKAP